MRALPVSAIVIDIQAFGLHFRGSLGAEFCAFPEIVVRSSRHWYGAVLEGLRIVFHHSDYSAILAHLEAVQGLLVGEHDVTLQL